jgi:hypothetical protein
MLEIFSTRELASALWITFFVLGFGTQAFFRRGLAGIVRSALAPKLSVPGLLLGAYVVGLVWLLWVSGFWTVELLKATILWFVLTGLVLPFSIAADHGKGSVTRRIVTESVGIIVFLEFVVATYTFHFLIEFLLVPTVGVLVLTNAVAERQGQASTASVTAGLQGLVGIVIIVSAIAKAVREYLTTGAGLPLRNFALPIVLTCGLIPVTYGLRYYLLIDELLIRLRMSRHMDPAVRRYAGWRILSHTRGSIRKAQTLLDEIKWELTRVRSRDDVDQLFAPLPT